MKLASAPLPFPPNACVITGRDDGILIDFEHDFTAGVDPRIYIKAELIEEAAELLGMVRKARVDALQDRFNEMATELYRLQELANALNDVEESVRHLEVVSDPPPVAA